MIKVVRSDVFPFVVEDIDELPEIDARHMLNLYRQGDHGGFIEQLEQVFEQFAAFPSILKIDGDHQAALDELVGTVLHVLSQEDFRVDAEHIRSLFSPMAAMFTNLVALSSYRTTDGCLRRVLDQQDHLLRALFLCTANNTVRPAMEEIIRVQPRFAASLWWLNHYAVGAFCYSDKTTFQNMYELLAAVPDELALTDVRTMPLYALSTYVDPALDRHVKRQINRSAQRVIARRGYAVNNTPRPGKIAVAASRWNGVSAIYKTSAPHIHALRDRGYHLTLIHLNEFDVRGVQGEAAEREFDDIREVTIDGSEFDFGSIKDNEFELIYYPDIGMNNPSVWLANMQIAPIQVMGLGHPVSTYGAKIDYIISGAEVELADRYAENYTERLVLIPGLGAAPVDPGYARRHPARDPGVVVINCPWTLPKVNYPILQALKRIQDGADVPVAFNFFPSWTWGRHPYHSAHQYFADLNSALERVRIIPEMPYHDCLEVIESGHLSLLPHPYGGCNTVIDSLVTGLPVVCIEGTKWYNRSGPGLIRRIGLDELIVADVDAYVGKTIKLVNDADYRQALCERIDGADLDAMFFDPDEPRYFADAIEYLIAHHQSLEGSADRSPIRIGH